MFLYESDCLTKTSRKPTIIMEKEVDQKNMIEAFETDPSSRFDSKTGLFKPRLIHYPEKSGLFDPNHNCQFILINSISSIKLL